MSSTGTSLWRVAGMSYLQYVNKSAGILREALKEPIKSKLTPRTNVEFAGFKWADGERGKRGKQSALIAMSIPLYGGKNGVYSYVCYMW